MMMNLREQLLVEMSRQNMDYVCNYVGRDGKLVAELFQLVFENEKKLSLRAAWALSIISDKSPDLLRPYTSQMIEKLGSFKHNGIHRLFLRFLAETAIPEDQEGLLFDQCYQWLISADEPPGVKVFCMQILMNIAQKEPDLKRELLLIFEELTDHESAAIRNRSRKMLGRR
jgi:hypothetical protein